MNYTNNMEKSNYYKNVHNQYGENAVFYCNGPYLVLLTEDISQTKSIKVSSLNPNDWKIHNEPLIKGYENLQALVLSYRLKLTGSVLEDYDNHFKITSDRYGKI